MENAHIYRIVSETLHQFKTSNPFELCAMMDVNVRYADLGSLKGMYKYIAGNAFIIINSSLDCYTSKIICSHELAHHILHSHIARTMPVYETMLFDMSARIEAEANIFVAELLISDKAMLHYAREGKTVQEISALSETDVNIVKIKAASMYSRGYTFLNNFDIKSDFLKSFN